MPIRHRRARPSSRALLGARGRGAGAAVSARPFLRPLVLLLLAAAVFAAFAGVLRNGWIRLDDPGYVLAEPARQRAALTARRAPLVRCTQPHGGNWHPLTSLSHMLDVQLFGLRPAGHHAVSLLLHVAERRCCSRSCSSA